MRSIGNISISMMVSFKIWFVVLHAQNVSKASRVVVGAFRCDSAFCTKRNPGVEGSGIGTASASGSVVEEFLTPDTTIKDIDFQKSYRLANAFNREREFPVSPDSVLSVLGIHSENAELQLVQLLEREMELHGVDIATKDTRENIATSKEMDVARSPATKRNIVSDDEYHYGDLRERYLEAVRNRSSSGWRVSYNRTIEEHEANWGWKFQYGYRSGRGLGTLSKRASNVGVHTKQNLLIEKVCGYSTHFNPYRSEGTTYSPEGTFTSADNADNSDTLRPRPPTLSCLLAHLLVLRARQGEANGGTIASFPSQIFSYFETVRTIATHTPLKTICEIGMGPGLSTLLFVVATEASSDQRRAVGHDKMYSTTIGDMRKKETPNKHEGKSEKTGRKSNKQTRKNELLPSTFPLDRLLQTSNNGLPNFLTHTNPEGTGGHTNPEGTAEDLREDLPEIHVLDVGRFQDDGYGGAKNSAIAYIRDSFPLRKIEYHWGSSTFMAPRFRMFASMREKHKRKLLAEVIVNEVSDREESHPEKTKTKQKRIADLLQQWNETHPYTLRRSCDIVHIDGAHQHAIVARDLRNMQRWSHKHTIVFLDDLNDPEVGIPVRQAIDQGIMELFQVTTQRGGCNGHMYWNHTATAVVPDGLTPKKVVSRERQWMKEGNKIALAGGRGCFKVFALGKFKGVPDRW